MAIEIFPFFYNYQSIDIDCVMNILNNYGLDQGRKLNQLYKRFLIKKGLRKPSMEIGSKYTTMVGKFHFWYQKMIRKLL